MATLYIFVGAPGSGKTTAAQIIANRTGAEHIWVDHERADMFRPPTHSESESQDLYDYLNDKIEAMLKSGHSVVFDTNFNRLSDRELMRQIVKAAGAKLKIIHLTTKKNLAKNRSGRPEHARKNGMPSTMTEDTFDDITSHYQALGPDEPVVEIDGTDINADELMQKLSSL